MIKMELIFNLSAINLTKFSKKEKSLFISYLLSNFYRELLKKFNSYGQIRTHINKTLFIEDPMLEANFLIYLIEDILSTKEYSLLGIAIYARVPEDMIFDLFAGLNKNPSSSFWNKIIELHSTVRRELYQELISKIISNNKDKDKDNDNNQNE